MPPSDFVPRKVQMGRPAKIAKPRVSSQAPVPGPRRPSPPKPPVTRGQMKKQVTNKVVAVADPEGDAAAPVDAEYETDDLAELPTDSEPEVAESELREETAQKEEQ